MKTPTLKSHRTRVTLRIDKNLLRALDQHLGGDVNAISRNTWVNDAIAEKLNRLRAQPEPPKA